MSIDATFGPTVVYPFVPTHPRTIVAAHVTANGSAHHKTIRIAHRGAYVTTQRVSIDATFVPTHVHPFVPTDPSTIQSTHHATIGNSHSAANRSTNVGAVATANGIADVSSIVRAFGSTNVAAILHTIRTADFPTDIDSQCATIERPHGSTFITANIGAKCATDAHSLRISHDPAIIKANASAIRSTIGATNIGSIYPTIDGAYVTAQCDSIVGALGATNIDSIDAANIAANPSTNDTAHHPTVGHPFGSAKRWSDVPTDDHPNQSTHHQTHHTSFGTTQWNSHTYTDSTTNTTTECVTLWTTHQPTHEATQW